MLFSLMLGLLASPLQPPALAAPAQDLAPSAGPSLVLRGSMPPGPVGDLLKGLQANTGLVVTSDAADPWPAWTDHQAWSAAEPWQLWLDAMEQTSDAEAGPQARRNLAALAHKQSRPEDTWAHLQHLSAPDAAALLPQLVAGIAPGASEAPPVLEPILPPFPVYDIATWRELPPLREYRIEGLQIGATTFTVGVQVPPEGVEVRFVHESGPPLELRVRIPVPSNRVKRIEYVDWTRVNSEEGVNPVHTITLLPDSEDLILWARCMPRRLPWPTPQPGAAFPTDRNIELATTADDASLGRLQAMAAAASKLLKVDVSVTTRAQNEPAPPGRSALRIDLVPGPFREAKIASLLSQMEAQSAQFR